MPDKTFDQIPEKEVPTGADLAVIDDVAAVPVATSRATLSNLAKAFTSPSGAAAVGTARSIGTTAPLTGGGDLSADRTLALTTSPAGQTPVGVTRAINTTAPVTGGGDLSADRTIAVSDFVASGASHARGTVPDPGAVAGTTKFLREDATFAVPPGTGVTAVTGTAPIASSGGTTPAISLNDTAVTPGSYTSADITVDAKGRLTAAANGAGGTVLAATNDFRISLVTADPVPSADQVGIGTVFLTPFKGNAIALADGSGVFTIRTTAEVSVALASLTSDKNYDVWARWTGSAVALDLSAAWTNDTTRADAIARSSGVWTKSGDTTRRLVGTIRATGAATTEDSAAKRFVWNASNRVRRSCIPATETADNYQYQTDAWRQANANTANQIDYVCGLAEDAVEAEVWAAGISGSNNDIVSVGVGVNSTTVNSAKLYGTTLSSGGAYGVAYCSYRGIPGIGRNTLAWIERGKATSTVTWRPDSGSPNNQQAGMTGSVMA